MHAQEIITRIKDAGATTWEEVRDVLEDGEALAALGITDEHQEAVEIAHALAVAEL